MKPFKILLLNFYFLYAYRAINIQVNENSEGNQIESSICFLQDETIVVVWTDSNLQKVAFKRYQNNLDIHTPET